MFNDFVKSYERQEKYAGLLWWPLPWRDMKGKLVGFIGTFIVYKNVICQEKFGPRGLVKKVGCVGKKGENVLYCWPECQLKQKLVD